MKDKLVKIWPTTSNSSPLRLARLKRLGIGIEIRINVIKLVAGKERLALGFLNLHPLENLTLIGFIRDHGLEDERNRGSFYGYYCDDRLSGVALIGHHTLLSCDANAAQYFAQTALSKHKQEINNLLGEKEAVEAFGQIFNERTTGRKVKCQEQETLCVATHRTQETLFKTELCQVQKEDLDEVSALHARTYLEWNGIDPSVNDPEGFRQRMLARIEKGRIWIVRDEKGIAFKTDIVSESPEAVYLEGVWTRADLRDTGLGSTVLQQLCQKLMEQYPAICLYVSNDDKRAISFYQKVGFQIRTVSQLVRYVPAGN